MTNPVSVEDFAGDVYIVAQLTGGARTPVPLLDELPLGEAILAMERLGRAWLNQDMLLPKARQAFGIRPMFAHGYRVLADLPAMAPKLFDRVMAGHGARKGRWGATRAYGDLHHWILRLPAGALGDALRGEFETTGCSRRTRRAVSSIAWSGSCRPNRWRAPISPR